MSYLERVRGERGDRPASERLVAVVGVLVGFLAGTVWVTAADMSSAGSVPVAVAGTTLERAGGRVAELASEVTVGVEAQGCGGAWSGSGVVSAGGLVVTAAHVTAGAHRVTVTRGAQRSAAGPVLSAVGVDVASASLAAGWRGVSRRSDDPSVGESVVIGARPRGVLRVRRAKVEGYLRGTGPQDPDRVMRLDVTVAAGDSGGPVLDRDGRLVGIVYAAEHGSGRALVIPASRLTEALGAPATPGRC